MINVKELALPEVKLLMSDTHLDKRGYLAEVAQHDEMQKLGLPINFVQENQSLSYLKNTVRGLHFQMLPHAQAKLVRVLRGKIFDVAVDVRPRSPSFGKHVSAVLNDTEVTQMLIPPGFAHGFCSLEDNTVVLYKISDYYAPKSECGVIWNDPDLHIDWPVDATNVILSDKDQKLPRLKDLPAITW